MLECEERKVTNYQFWKALEEIMKEPFGDEESLTEFSMQLIKGYIDKDEIKIWCTFIENQFSPGTFYQSYLNTPGGKNLVCFTRKEYAEKDNRRLREEGAKQIKTKLVPLRELIEELFTNDNIIGLVFNPIELEHMYYVNEKYLRTIIIKMTKSHFENQNK